METIENIPLKPKRIRSNPTKRWTVAEEKALIDFLLENQEKEKPTAQAFYRRFSEEKGNAIEWKLVRSKVRNMRTNYNKAKAWEGSTGAGSMDGGTVKSTLIKICSHFDELDEIFGSRSMDSYIIEESLEVSICNELDAETLNWNATSKICNELDAETLNSNATSEICNELDKENTNSTATSEINFSETAMEPENSVVEIGKKTSTSRKGLYSRTAVSDIMKVQTEMIKLKKQKMEQELSIKEKELKLKEREVMLKEKEMALKEKELYSQEKLKMLELEMKERLAMEELRKKFI